jgi:hypothetical protein
MTKEERETLQALSDKAKAEEEADATYELRVKKGDHEVTLTGAKARAFARKFGIEDDDADASEGESEQSEESDDPPARTAGYFNKSRDKKRE